MILPNSGVAKKTGGCLLMEMKAQVKILVLFGRQYKDKFFVTRPCFNIRLS